MYPHTIENIVFSGGGQRGFAYVGCLQALACLGVPLKTLKGVGGTSIGAIFALAVALQYTVEELEHRVRDLDMQAILQLDLRELYYNYGLDSGVRIRQYLSDMLEHKQFSPNITFAQLWRRRTIKFVVVVADLQSVSAHMCSIETTPNVKVLDAVIASLSIPVLFVPSTLTLPTTTETTATRIPHVGQPTFVDGGLLNNFPIHAFPLEKTLGLRLCWSTQAQKVCFSTLDQYLARVAYCVLSQAEQLQNMKMKQLGQFFVVDVDVNVSTVDFRLGANEKQQVMGRGAWCVLKSFPCHLLVLMVKVLLSGVA